MANKPNTAQFGFAPVYLLILFVIVLVASSVFWFIYSNQSEVSTKTLKLTTRNSPSPAPSVQTQECTSDEQLIPLFTNSDKKVDSTTLSRPTTIRSRIINLNIKHLNLETPKILLNLFPDKCMIAVRDKSSLSMGGGFTWSGHVGKNEPGTVVLSIVEDALYGYIDNYKEAESYEIRSNQEGNHVVIQIDKTKFPPD